MVFVEREDEVVDEDDDDDDDGENSFAFALMAWLSELKL
jgi:hypothetical protein